MKNIRVRSVLVILIVLFFRMPAAAELGKLYGFIKWEDASLAEGVTMTIGGYSTVTDRHGYYTFDLSAGKYVVLISPPEKSSKPFWAWSPGQQDFTIDW